MVVTFYFLVWFFPMRWLHQTHKWKKKPALCFQVDYTFMPFVFFFHWFCVCVRFFPYELLSVDYTCTLIFSALLFLIDGFFEPIFFLTNEIIINSKVITFFFVLLIRYFLHTFCSVYKLLPTRVCLPASNTFQVIISEGSPPTRHKSDKTHRLCYGVQRQDYQDLTSNQKEKRADTQENKSNPCMSDLFRLPT